MSDGITGLFSYQSLPNSTKVLDRDLHVIKDKKKTIFCNERTAVQLQAY